MKVRQVCDVLEYLAPLEWAEQWDSPGLNVGALDSEVSCVLVALTATRGAFDEARDAGAQMIVTHHPLLWSPLTALRTDDPATRLCLDIAQAGMACYAAHTNLDVAPGGVNHALARVLGLQDVAPLLPVAHARQVKLVTFVPEGHLAAVRDAVCQAGAGVIGDYTHCTFSTSGIGTFRPGDAARPHSGESNVVNEQSEQRLETIVDKARLGSVIEALMAAHPYEEVAYDIVPIKNRPTHLGLGVQARLAEATTLRAFARHARSALGVSHVRYVGEAEHPVRHVGVIGGSGAGEVADIPRTIDVLLTGDVKYHQALAAVDRGLALVDVGHDASERVVVPVLAEYLRQRLPSLCVRTYAEPACFNVVTED